MAALPRWFTLAVYEHEEDRRMARIQLIMIVVYWVSNLITLVLDLVWGDKSLAAFLILGSILQLLSMFLLFRGKLSSSNFLSVGLYIIFTTLFATFGQGIHDYVLMAYPAIIMFAGLISQRRGLIMSFLLTSAALLWLVFGENNGWFVARASFNTHWTDFVAAEIILIITALAMYLLVSNLEYGLAQVWRELAERKRVQVELRNIQDNLQAITDATQQSFILIDRDGKIVSFNRMAAQTIRALMGVDMQSGDARSKFVLDINRPEFVEHFTRVLNGEIITVENSISHSDGKEIWLSFTYNPVHATDGSIVGVCLNVMDVTARKQAENALAQSREMYRLLAENISDVIWIFDVNENHTRYISPSVERLRGYTPDEVMGKDMSTALTPASMQEVQSKMAARVKLFQAGQRDSYVDRLEQLRKDGTTVWTEVNTSFHVNENNGHLEMYGVSRDITERKQHEEIMQAANEQLKARVEEIERLHEELREQAIRDPLSGLYNRRYMQDVFIREFSRAAREILPLSVLFFDLDALKVLNDTYGHHIGDRAIQVFAFCLKNLIRVEDVACRYGGDEFTVVMSKTTAEDAARRIEEWRGYLNAHPVEIDATHSAVIGFTAGIASFPVHGTSVEEVVNHADVALYRAKARGRNCTVVFEE